MQKAYLTASLLFIISLTLLSQASANACYSSVQTMPVSCEGGNIVEDSWNGCRTVNCVGTEGSIKVLACNKPDRQSPAYFEAYKQSSTGISPKVCIGDTCLQANGFIKSSNYPYCTETPTNNSNSTNVCVVSVKDTHASCVGGTISYDNVQGACRSIVCEGEGGVLSVLSCDKPDTGSKQYFEMYKQFHTGGANKPSKVCLDTTCIADNGYAKSANFQSCSQPTTTTTGGGSNSNNTNSTTQISQLSVSVAPWYPKENNYIFNCDAQGYNPSEYSITFGDGEKIVHTHTNSFYHTYKTPGQYTISCTGTDQNQVSKTGTLQVTVQSIEQVNQTNQSNQDSLAQIQILPPFPQEHNYAFACAVDGFTPSSYTWDFSDGTQETRTVNEIYHTFPSSGTYQVSCEATDGTRTALGNTEVQVETPLTSTNKRYYADLQIISSSGLNYDLVCTSLGYEATPEYDGYTSWRITGVDESGNRIKFNLGGDTSWSTTLPGETISYSFPTRGNYTVECSPFMFDERQYYKYYEVETYHNQETLECSRFNSGCTFGTATETVQVQ